PHLLPLAQEIEGRLHVPPLGVPERRPAFARPAAAEIEQEDRIPVVVQPARPRKHLTPIRLPAVEEDHRPLRIPPRPPPAAQFHPVGGGKSDILNLRRGAKIGEAAVAGAAQEQPSDDPGAQQEHHEGEDENEQSLSDHPGWAPYSFPRRRKNIPPDR